MASTQNQKNNTRGRAKLLILLHHEETQGKCCSQFISVSLQSPPLNVTLSNIPSSKMFCIFNRKMCMDSELRWTELLCEEVCVDTLTKSLEFMNFAIRPDQEHAPT